MKSKSDWRDNEGPQTLRERVGWWLIGADPYQVAKDLETATEEISDTDDPIRPHAKDRAMMAVASGAKRLGLYEPENAFSENP